MKSGKITAVHRDIKNKHRYHFYIGDELVFSVHEDILVKYQLAKGVEVDDGFVREILWLRKSTEHFCLPCAIWGSDRVLPSR